MPSVGVQEATEPIRNTAYAAADKLKMFRLLLVKRRAVVWTVPCFYFERGNLRDRVLFVARTFPSKFVNIIEKCIHFAFNMDIFGIYCMCL